MQPDKRLMSAIAFARKGKRFADIGTDHAFIPIYLTENNISTGGVASDINEGPVGRAKMNISEAGLSDCISVLKTDGLNGIEAFGPDDIFILGMGGELISSIISSAEFIRNSRYRIILQPMTHAEEVRKTLGMLGFRIIGEAITRDGHRFYQVIAAEYDGKVRNFSEVELILGKCGMKAPTEILYCYAEYLIRVYQKKITGLKKSGADAGDTEKIIGELNKFLSDRAL